MNQLKQNKCRLSLFSTVHISLSSSPGFEARRYTNKAAPMWALETVDYSWAQSSLQNLSSHLVLSGKNTEYKLLLFFFCGKCYRMEKMMKIQEVNSKVIKTFLIVFFGTPVSVSVERRFEHW